ncbi:MAG: DUF2807 domain-containing protein [Saprospiraceae bacterium]|nr:DUF2807 domain-containing protein [Saprospiraceae bacterium]
MRYLLVFMLLVGIFVVGKRSCFFGNMGGIDGAGPKKTETRSVTGFHQVNLDISADVDITIGDYKVEVEGYENLLPALTTEVDNGVLTIAFNQNVSYDDNIKIRISAPSFDGFTVSGSGLIEANGPIQADNLTLNMGGSGEVKIAQANLGALRCEISGSGDIAIAGKSNSGIIQIDGSGELHAKQMEFNELRAGISGSGTVNAHVIQVLKASISGSGDIYYTGDPSVQSDISGSGSVKKLPSPPAQ